MEQLQLLTIGKIKFHEVRRSLRVNGVKDAEKTPLTNECLRILTSSNIHKYLRLL